jgi:hypothetical protein
VPGQMSEEHVRANNGDAVYAKCLCGAKRCKGYMFKNSYPLKECILEVEVTHLR